MFGESAWVKDLRNLALVLTNDVCVCAPSQQEMDHFNLVEMARSVKGNRNATFRPYIEKTAEEQSSLEWVLTEH